MSITTYAELKSAISDWLNRDDLASVVDSFIDLAEARFRRERLYTDAKSRPLEPAPREYIQSQRYATDDGTGAPRFYAITDSQLELYPTPADATDVEMLYYEEIPALSDGQTTNWLLTDAPDVYLYGSLVHTAPYLADDPRAQIWAGLYQSAVEELHRASERAKWGGPLNLRPAKRSS
jgi:hypothetical protein